MTLIGFSFGFNYQILYLLLLIGRIKEQLIKYSMLIIGYDHWLLYIICYGYLLSLLFAKCV